MDAQAKQGFGAAMASIGSGVILGWIACMAIDGNNRQQLAGLGLGLTLAGGATLTAGHLQERKEMQELANTYWSLTK